METCLVTEGLEVLHDLPHVLDRHDDETRGAQEEEAAGPGQAGRHGNSPQELSASLYLSIKASNCQKYVESSLKQGEI